MNAEQYRLWRRRILVALRQFGEAAYAESRGDDDAAAKLRENAGKFLANAKDMERFEKLGWVLTLYRPLGMEDVQPSFVGTSSLVEDPGDARHFTSFDEACASRSSLQEITNRFPEPLNYHIELFNSRNSD